MANAKLKKALQWIAGGILGVIISTAGYHYIVGQSWDFVLHVALGGIALVPVGLAISYMRRWFGPDQGSGVTFFSRQRAKNRDKAL